MYWQDLCVSWGVCKFGYGAGNHAVLGGDHFFPVLGDSNIGDDADIVDVGAVVLGKQELCQPEYRAVALVVGVEVFAITSCGFANNERIGEAAHARRKHFGCTGSFATGQNQKFALTKLGQRLVAGYLERVLVLAILLEANRATITKQGNHVEH